MILCTACAMLEKTETAPAAPAAQSAPAASSAPTQTQAPAAPQPPRAPTAEERRNAEQLAIDSINRLQVGDVAGGRALLDQALALDPKNELAKLMLKQLNVDPVTELGAASFPYTIERDETLAKIAQRFLGDRFLFYLLARYNDIAQPNQIHAGQVIRIPGKAPATTAAATPSRPVPPPAVPAPAPTPTPEPARPAVAPPAPADDATARRLADGRDEERKGNFDGAMAAYADVLRRDPANAEAKQRYAGAHGRAVDAYYADGVAAFARQDLDKAIAAWDRVLVLEPEHQNAKLKRQQALDLKDKLKRFEKKP